MATLYIFRFKLLLSICIFAIALAAGSPAHGQFTYSATADVVGYDFNTGAVTDTAKVELQIQDSDAIANRVNGFSMGLSHDSTYFSVLSIDPSPFLLTGELGGGMPSFFSANSDSSGLTIGVVFSLEGSLFFDSIESVIEVEYAVDASSLIGNAVGVTSDLSWTDALGNPPVLNQLAIIAGTSNALQSDSSIQLIPALSNEFLRGDCNQDGAIDIGDPIIFLASTFHGTIPDPNSTCLAAWDINLDGNLNIADPIRLLSYLFGEVSIPLEAPFPLCGPGIGIDCATSTCP